MSNLIMIHGVQLRTHRAQLYGGQFTLSSTVLRTVHTVLNCPPLYLESSTVLSAQRKSQIYHLINQTQLNLISKSTLFSILDTTLH